MGIDVEAKLVHVPVEAGSEQINLLKENGKTNHGSGITEPIKFGSHGTEEPKKEEVGKIPVSNVPKDAVEDWPEPKQIHSFYTVKFRRFEDPKLKAKIELAEKELQKKNQARSQIIEKLKAKRAERSKVIEQRKALGAENKEFWSAIDDKKKEMEPLREALGKLGVSRNAGRERGPVVCSSEQELNNLIKSLQYRIQHESIPLTEEKQILREIKQLEGTRKDVKNVAATRAQIHEAMGEKESIQNQVKLMSVGLDGVRKGQQEVKAKLKQIDDQIDGISKQISLLDEELKEVVEKRDKTYEHILELRKQREEGNSSFYQNSNVLHKVKQLADQKDVGALKELSVIEVDKFMSLWSGSKPFRDDYERRLLQSLDIRQLSRDGRMRNPAGTLAANCEKLLRTMEHLVSNEAKVKCTINELESKLLSSECQILQMTEENSSLKIQLHTLPLLQEEVLDLKRAVSWMKFESERLQVTLQLKYEDCEELKEEKASLLKEISCMHEAVAEAEECKYKKIALEEKVLRLEGDLTAKEVMCAKVSELKNELCQLRRQNSQLLSKIRSLQLEKEDYLKQVESLEGELKRKQSDYQREDESTFPTVEKLKLSQAEEEDFSKHRCEIEDFSKHQCEIKDFSKHPCEIITQSPQSEKYLKVQKIQGNSHQDGNKESNYNRDLQETVAKSVSVIKFSGDTVAQTLERNCIHEPHQISLSSKGRDENMQKISQLEAELQEIRDRYLNMSLKYAEVEDQREQLVITLKAINDQKTSRGYRSLSSFWSAGADT